MGAAVWRIVSSEVSLLAPFLAVLCAERVGQMTKTYNDIDAVTRLLEEVSVLGGGKESLISDRISLILIKAYVIVHPREDAPESGPLRV